LKYDHFNRPMEKTSITICSNIAMYDRTIQSIDSLDQDQDHPGHSHEKQKLTKNVATHFNILTCAVKRGNGNAMFDLAICFKTGECVERNIDQSIQLLKRAAMKGHAEANYYMGLHFYNRYDTYLEKDLKLASIFFEYAKNKGHLKATHNLGYYYDCYAGDKKKACALYRYSAKRGLDNSMFNLALIYNKGAPGIKRNKKKAFYWFNRAAPMDLDALLQVGNFHFLGRGGIPENKTKALQIYKKCAEHGDAFAMSQIAWFYENGCVVEKNMETAITYWQGAAARGNVHAMYSIGRCYAVGQGVEINPKQAIQYLISAIEKDYIMASIFLQNYYHGLARAGSIDYIDLLESGTKMGCRIAPQLLGGVYCLEQKFEKVLHYFNLAVRRGNDRALIDMGKYYQDNSDDDKKYEKAFMFFEKAALKDYPEAFYNSTQCHRSGYGCEKNPENAVINFIKASGQGFYLATSTLVSYMDELKSHSDYTKLLDFAIFYGTGNIANDLGNHFFNVIKDYKTAQICFTAAVNKGHVLAHYNLAIWHETKGENLKKSIRLYLKAQANDLPLAITRLKELCIKCPLCRRHVTVEKITKNRNRNGNENECIICTEKQCNVIVKSINEQDPCTHNNFCFDCYVELVRRVQEARYG
jgi:TPR repeat protein